MNVKPGDLARVIDGGVNHNRQVLVLEGHDACSCGLFSWQCEALQTLVGNHKWFGETTIFPGGEIWIHDADLRRIDPPPEEEPTATDKELQA